MSTAQKLIDGVNGLHAGRLEHCETELKTRLKFAITNYTTLDAVMIPIYWGDLAALIKIAQSVEDEVPPPSELTLNEYQRKAMSTAIYPGQGSIFGLIYTVLGLANEAGEVAGKLKKALRDDLSDQINGILLNSEFADIRLSPERRVQIAEELGDAMWYGAASADQLEFPLEIIAAGNNEKLADRQVRDQLGGDGDKR